PRKPQKIGPKRRAALMSSTDFSMMTETDVANIVLQRPDIVSAGPQIRAWMKGDSAPLLALAAEKRGFLLSAGLEAAEKACATFTDATDALAPGRVADIGCGYAFADLFLYRRYGCDLAPTDIWKRAMTGVSGSTRTHPGYTSLERARAFLVANGAPAGARSPRSTPPDPGEVSGLGAIPSGDQPSRRGFPLPGGEPTRKLCRAGEPRRRIGDPHPERLRRHGEAESSVRVGAAKPTGSIRG
ncbi:MAG: hypothetical protein U5L09_09240, partial [Bacteroidales bacterium]|nr:hypothetical protein [Bacteroidales bacterium]